MRRRLWELAASVVSILRLSVSTRALQLMRIIIIIRVCGGGGGLEGWKRTQ